MPQVDKRPIRPATQRAIPSLRILLRGWTILRHCQDVKQNEEERGLNREGKGPESGSDGYSLFEIGSERTIRSTSTPRRRVWATSDRSQDRVGPSPRPPTMKSPRPVSTTGSGRTASTVARLPRSMTESEGERRRQRNRELEGEVEIRRRVKESRSVCTTTRNEELRRILI